MRFKICFCGVNNVSLHHGIWKSSSMVYTTKSIFSFHGVHHKMQSPLPWCTPRNCQNPLPWCTPRKPFTASMVYTMRLKICFCGVNNVSLHHRILKSSSMVYTTKSIFSFHGVHHGMQNLLLWCTPRKEKMAPHYHLIHWYSCPALQVVLWIHHLVLHLL